MPAKSPPQKGNINMHTPVCNKKISILLFFVSQDLDEAAVDRDVQRIHLPVKLVDYDIAETQTPNPLLSVKCFFVGSLSRASAS